MDLKEQLLTAMTAALNKYYIKGSGGCSCKNCPNKPHAKGLCNAHYLRKRLNRDMQIPVRTSKLRTPNCLDCGKLRNGKGGHGFCTNCWRSRRRLDLKIAILQVFGNKCSKCHGVFPTSVYDFHHTNAKIKNPSYSLDNSSLAAIAEELSSCIVLCANCHRIHHNG